MTKTIKLKISDQGYTSLQQVNAPLGLVGNSLTIEVTKVPQDVTPYEVKRLYDSHMVRHTKYHEGKVLECWSVDFERINKPTMQIIQCCA